MKLESVGVQSALIGIVTGLLSAFVATILTTHFQKNNEIETRLFEIKSENYEGFLDNYIAYFNNGVIYEEYKKNFERNVAYELFFGCDGVGLSRLVEDHIGETMEILESDLKYCYTDDPLVCIHNTGTCYGRPISELIFYKDFGASTPNYYLASIIGDMQDFTLRQVLEKQYSKFQESSYKYKLHIPENIYDQVENYVYQDLPCVNCNRDCNSATADSCGFNFTIFPIDDPNANTFISSQAIEDLKADLQSHY